MLEERGSFPLQRIWVSKEGPLHHNFIGQIASFPHWEKRVLLLTGTPPL